MAGNNQDHANRFADLSDGLDVIGTILAGEGRADALKTFREMLVCIQRGVISLNASLRDFLQCWVNNTIVPNGKAVTITPLHFENGLTAMGNQHRVWVKRGDSRRELPKSLKRMLTDREVIVASKVYVSWVVAYINGVLPNRNAAGWQFFELSHLCIEAGMHTFGRGVTNAQGFFESCVDHNCFVWESKAANQARANPACRKLCHCQCGVYVCVANDACQPNCR
jgi:hypothetical protein